MTRVLGPGKAVGFEICLFGFGIWYLLLNHLTLPSLASSRTFPGMSGIFESTWNHLESSHPSPLQGARFLENSRAGTHFAGYSPNTTSPRHHYSKVP